MDSDSKMPDCTKIYPQDAKSVIDALGALLEMPNPTTYQMRRFVVDVISMYYRSFMPACDGIDCGHEGNLKRVFYNEEK